MTEKEPTTPAKYSRSINLEPQIAERLHRLCEHLGVTVNSYLKLEIGKVLARDETSLLPKQAIADQTAIVERAMATLLGGLSGEQQLELDVSEQPPKRQTTRKRPAP